MDPSSLQARSLKRSRDCLPLLTGRYMWGPRTGPFDATAAFPYDLEPRRSRWCILRMIGVFCEPCSSANGMGPNNYITTHFVRLWAQLHFSPARSMNSVVCLVYMTHQTWSLASIHLLLIAVGSFTGGHPRLHRPSCDAHTMPADAPHHPPNLDLPKAQRSIHVPTEKAVKMLMSAFGSKETSSSGS